MMFNSTFKRPTKRMKSRGPKMTKIRKAARGEECCIMIKNACRGGTETTVLCHSNDLTDGHAMGIKADDLHAAFGCVICHDIYDRRAPLPVGVSHDEVESDFKKAIGRTHERLKIKGLI